MVKHLPSFALDFKWKERERKREREREREREALKPNFSSFYLPFQELTVS
jgi:hypothetical protein